MNSLLDDTEDEHERPIGRRVPVDAPDREITLGTTMILLIFFALAVQDAAVFGFGFSMGSKHSGGTSTAAAPQSSAGLLAASKPSPGNPLGSAAAVKPGATDSTPTPLATPVPAKTTAAPIERVAVDSDEPTPAPAPVKPLAAAAASVSTPAAAIPVAPTVPAGPGTFVVQVAALSRQDDADRIGDALRRRGYLVNIRTDADHLLHVQVGPFASRKDADAMKARLLADGFNAIIK